MTTPPAAFNGARFLVDTSVLLPVADLARPHHVEAVAALPRLKSQGALLHIAPQNLVELWAVATRPPSANGLGHASSTASALLQRFKAAFALLPETPAVFEHWERIVLANDVSGKPTHDARLVAFMKVHGLSHLLTFNGADFRRFEAGEGVVAIDPAAIAPPSP